MKRKKSVNIKRKIGAVVLASVAAGITLVLLTFGGKKLEVPEIAACP